MDELFQNRVVRTEEQEVKGREVVHNEIMTQDTKTKKAAMEGKKNRATRGKP